MAHTPAGAPQGLALSPSPPSFELATRASTASGALGGGPLDAAARGEGGGTGEGGDRWSRSLANVQAAAASLDALGGILQGTAVYLDESPFQNSHAAAIQSRTIKAQERRIRVLEREADAAAAAARHEQAKARAAQAAQRAAEARSQQLAEELEATSAVFKVHADELEAKQKELEKKGQEVAVLQAIIRTLSEKPARA